MNRSRERSHGTGGREEPRDSTNDRREREREKRGRGLGTNRYSEGEIDEFVPMREVMIGSTTHCEVELAS